MNLHQSKSIPDTFLLNAAYVIGDTSAGLDARTINKTFCAAAEKYGVALQHPTGAFVKSETIYHNLYSFAPKEQFKIIDAFCRDRKFQRGSLKDEIKDILNQLYTKYSEFKSNEELLSKNVESEIEARKLMAEYPKALKPYEKAIEYYNLPGSERDALDNLRLSLEFLLSEILGAKARLMVNAKGNELKKYLKQKGVSPYIAGMYANLCTSFALYQDDSIKHEIKLLPQEVDLIFDTATSLSKFIIKLDQQSRRKNGSAAINSTQPGNDIVLV